MLKQQLQLKLTQKLSPQQIQLMKLVQLPTLAFEQRVKEELEENPALEATEEHQDWEQEEAPEDDYNTMYNDAYAWQIGTQLSFFRENKCLFIGCSLTDPNIRRLIRMAEKERKKHFAIINKVQLINVNS